MTVFKAVMRTGHGYQALALALVFRVALASTSANAAELAADPVGTGPAIFSRANSTASVINEFFPSTKQQLKLVDEKHVQTEDGLRTAIQDLTARLNDFQAGATGGRGPPGGTGPTGAKGDTGAQGPSGTKGDKGADGGPGAAGMNGAKGDPGATGADGLTVTGPTGPAGPTGPTGADACCATCASLTSNGNQFCYDLFTPYDVSNATFFLENPTVDCGTGNEFKTRNPPTPVCVDTEITSEIKLACSEAKGTLYRVQPTDVCFSMTISRGFFSRIFDQDTSPEFCQLNHSLFPNVECATVKCLAPTGCGAAGGPPCTTDCGNALFGAICRTLQPNFLVCLPPNQPPPNGSNNPPTRPRPGRK